MLCIAFLEDDRPLEKLSDTTLDERAALTPLEFLADNELTSEL